MPHMNRKQDNSFRRGTNNKNKKTYNTMSNKDTPEYGKQISSFLIKAFWNS